MKESLRRFYPFDNSTSICYSYDDYPSYSDSGDDERFHGSSSSCSQQVHLKNRHTIIRSQSPRITTRKTSGSKLPPLSTVPATTSPSWTLGAGATATSSSVGNAKTIGGNIGGLNIVFCVGRCNWRTCFGCFRLFCWIVFLHSAEAFQTPGTRRVYRLFGVGTVILETLKAPWKHYGDVNRTFSIQS